MTLPVSEAVSTIPADTLRAYHAAEYRVFGVTTPFVLKIGVRSPELADCHRAYNVESSAFVTAWNPHGQSHPAQDNDAAQARLAARLRVRGFHILEARGEDPAGHWAAEDSVLVLGMQLPDACRLGREFAQNALLWAGVDACPRLILLI